MAYEQNGTHTAVAANGLQTATITPASQPSRPSMNPALNRYRVTDDLWKKLKPIIDELDPPVRSSGRKRIDPRAALDAIIYQMLTGCGWNKLPNIFPDDSSVHRTYQRWKRQGVLNRLWSTIVDEDLIRQTRAG